MLLTELLLIYDFINHNSMLNNSSDIDNWGRIKTIVEREMKLKKFARDWPRMTDSQGNNMIDGDYE